MSLPASSPPAAPHDASETTVSPGVLLLLLTPFLLNDTGNLLVRDPKAWVLQDYLWRTLALGLVAWLVWRRGVHLTGPRSDTAAAGRGAIVVWTLFTTAAGLWLIDGPGQQLLQLWPGTRTGFIPPLTAPGWREFDLSAGLALVAVSEELVFRGVLLPQLVRRFRSPWLGLLVSSLLFGLAHWSLGAGSVLQTALAGGLLGLCTLRTGRLWPAVFAHYVINLAAFT